MYNWYNALFPPVNIKNVELIKPVCHLHVGFVFGKLSSKHNRVLRRNVNKSNYEKGF